MGDIEAKLAAGLKELEEVVTQLYIEGVGVDINAKDSDKGKALEWACQRGYTTAARILIERGIYSFQALKDAATGGHDSLIRLLIEKTPTIDIQNHGRDALMSAIAGDHKSTVLLLLEQLRNIEVDLAGGQTPLLYAADMGREALAILLIERGANIDAKCKMGKSVLAYASKCGSPAFLQKLADLGANVRDPDEFGDTPLHHAAGWGNKDAVSFLLENGAKPNERNEDGITALDVATEFDGDKRHGAVASLLSQTMESCARS